MKVIFQHVCEKYFRQLFYNQKQKHMKNLRSLTIAALLGAVTTGVTAQEVLPEVTVMAKNYKYMKAADTKNAPTPVNLLERKTAAYDIKNSEYYNDEYDSYSVTFYLPEGYVLGVYDQDGKLLRTAERFKDISLPPAVRTVTPAAGARR